MPTKDMATTYDMTTIKFHANQSIQIKNYHFSPVQFKQQTRKEDGGDNFEMKDFRARNRSHFVKRVHAQEGHGYHK
jgi:hypothetical protein